MRSLFGRGLHPDAEQIMALEQAAGTPHRDAAQAVKLGRAFPRYQPLPPRAGRVAARLAAFEAEHGHAPVAGGAVEDRGAGGPPGAPARSPGTTWSSPRSSPRRCCGRSGRPRPGRPWRTPTTRRSPTPWRGWRPRPRWPGSGTAGEQQIETRGFLATGVRPPRLPRRRPRPAHPPGDLEQGPRPRRPPRRPTPVAVAGRPRPPRRRGRRLRAVQHPLRGRPDPPPRRAVRRAARHRSATTSEPSARSPASPNELIRHFSKRRAAIEDRYTELPPTTATRTVTAPPPRDPAQAGPAGDPGDPRRQGSGPSSRRQARRMARRSRHRHRRTRHCRARALRSLRQPVPPVPVRTLDQVARAMSSRWCRLRRRP